MSAKLLEASWHGVIVRLPYVGLVATRGRLDRRAFPSCFATASGKLGNGNLARRFDWKR